MSVAAVFEPELLVSPDTNLDVVFSFLFLSCRNTMRNIGCNVFPWPAPRVLKGQVRRI